MTRSMVSAAAGVALIGLGSAAGMAHHSGSNYDFAHLVTFEGTVRQFQWTNPHVVIWVNVDHGEGEELWAVQMTSPGNLRRRGWTQRSLQPGERVRVVAAPMRDGTPAAGLDNITKLRTGEVLYHFGPPLAE